MALEFPDFGNVYSPGVTGFLSAYGNARRLKLAQEQHEQQVRHQTELEAIANRRANLDEKRAAEQHRQANVKFYQGQGEYIEKQRQKAREQIGRGDISAARAAVGDIPWLDVTGKQQFGLSFDEVGRPVEPKAPEVPPELADNIDYITRKPYRGSKTGGDPAETGDMAMDAYLDEALTEGRERMTAGAQADLERQASGREFLAKEADYEREAAGFPELMRRWEANRQFQIGGGPGGQPIVVAEQDERQRMGNQRNLDAQELATAIANDPNDFVKTYGPTLVNAVEGGGMTRGEAMKYLVALRSQDMNKARAAADRLAREKNARIMAGAARTNRDANLAERQRTGDRADQEFLRGSIKDWRASVDLAGSYKDFRLSKTALHNIGAKNSVQQRAAIYNLGRGINGPGPFSNQDAQLILGHTGGTAQQLYDFMQKVQTGEYDDATVDRFARAMEAQLEVVEARARDAVISFEERFERDPFFSNLQASVKTYKNSLFGPFGREREEVPPSTVSPAGPRAPGKGGGGRSGGKSARSVVSVSGPADQMDALLKRADDLLGGQ